MILTIIALILTICNLIFLIVLIHTSKGIEKHAGEISKNIRAHYDYISKYVEET